MDVGLAMVVAGSALQAAGPISAIVERLRRTRAAAAAIEALPFTPVPMSTPADMLRLLQQLD